MLFRSGRSDKQLSDKKLSDKIASSLKKLCDTLVDARKFPDDLSSQLRQLKLAAILDKEKQTNAANADGISAKAQADGTSADPTTVYLIVALMAELAGTWAVLDEFLTRAKYDPDIDDDEMPSRNDGPVNALQLLTIHKFKGRERPIVFVLGPSNGYMPDPRAVTDDEKEEERRVAYVAATRAKANLIEVDWKDQNTSPLESK